MSDEVLTRSMAPEELRTIMRSMGFSNQQQLSHAIGVSRSTVSLWLQGRVGVPRPVAMLLRVMLRAQRRPFQDGSGAVHQ